MKKFFGSKIAKVIVSVVSILVVGVIVAAVLLPATSNVPSSSARTEGKGLSTHFVALTTTNETEQDALPVLIMTTYGPDGCVEWTNDPAVVVTCPSP